VHLILPRFAAALRAAVDQVVPETEEPRNQLEYELGVWDARDDVRGELLAIAAELEGGND
jgi:phage shock protein A